jgi:hypothetical protein
MRSDSEALEVPEEVFGRDGQRLEEAGEEGHEPMVPGGSPAHIGRRSDLAAASHPIG